MRIKGTLQNKSLKSLFVYRNGQVLISFKNAVMKKGEIYLLRWKFTEPEVISELSTEKIVIQYFIRTHGPVIKKLVRSCD